jgi:hypothetical protein
MYRRTLRRGTWPSCLPAERDRGLDPVSCRARATTRQLAPLRSASLLHLRQQLRPRARLLELARRSNLEPHNLAKSRCYLSKFHWVVRGRVAQRLKAILMSSNIARA